MFHVTKHLSSLKTSENKRNKDRSAPLGQNLTIFRTRFLTVFIRKYLAMMHTSITTKTHGCKVY